MLLYHGNCPASEGNTMRNYEQCYLLLLTNDKPKISSNDCRVEWKGRHFLSPQADVYVLFSMCTPQCFRHSLLNGAVAGRGPGCRHGPTTLSPGTGSARSRGVSCRSGTTGRPGPRTTRLRTGKFSSTWWHFLCK